MENKNKECKKDVELEVHLEGKSNKSILISLDDLQNLVTGINGLSKYLIKKKFGKHSKYKFDKEMKEVCSLGVKSIRDGSAILEVQAFPDGQQKLDSCFEVSNIMKEMIEMVNGFDSNPDKFPLDALPYLDSFTKPLDKEGALLEISIVSEGKKTFTSKKLTVISRKQIQTVLDRKKLKSGVMYGTLKEINLKNYSGKIQLFNKKLETFFFDSSVWEGVRDLLESKVEIKFEGKGYNKKLLKIKEVRNYQQKRNMTGEDLLKIGVFGSMSYRDDLNDSVSYAKKLGDEGLK